MLKSKNIILEGPNMLLRPVETSDVNENYYRWMNDPEVNRFMETRFRPQSMDDIQSYAQKMIDSPDVLFMAIIYRKENLHIGNIKLGPISTAHLRGEISFFIGDKTLWGKGLASESVGLLTDYGIEKLGLAKITAGCYSNNISSQCVFEKLGFIRESVWKYHYICDGKFVDRISYAKLNPMINESALVVNTPT